MDREEAAKELMAMLEEAQEGPTILRKKCEPICWKSWPLATKYI